MVLPRNRSFVLSALLLGLALPVPAQVVFDGAFDGAGAQPFRLLGAPVPDNDWTVADPDGGLEDDSPSAPDRRRFWDRLQNKAFDQICKNINLKVGQGFDLGDVLGTKAELKRSLRRYPNGKFALMDEAKVRLSLGWNQRLLDIAGTSGLGISLGSSIEGESTVIRPTHSDKSCSQLGRLVKVYQFKAVLPLNAKRLAGMEEGELWKLPLTLRVGAGFGVGAIVEETFPVSINIGTSREDRVSATLFRLSDQELRFRLRLDHAVIRDRGGRILYDFPAMALGLPLAQNIILKEVYNQVDKLAARELNNYLSASLGLSFQKRKGRQLLIEFVVNPKDPEQLEALVQVLKGDLDILGMLMKSLKETKRLLRGDKTARQELDRMRQEYSDKLGTDDTFAGVDEYTRDGSRFHIQLPFLGDYERAKGENTDRLVLVDRTGGEYKVRRTVKTSDSAFIDIPFLGQITKHNTQKSAQTFVYKDADGNESSPMAVYTHQEGFLRRGADTARAMVEGANDVIKYAGVRGEGTNPDTILPVPELVKDEESLKRGVMVFSVAFSMKAVRDIIFAPADLVLRAYMNTLKGEDRRMMREIMLHSELQADGTLQADSRRVAEALGTDRWDENYHDVVQDIRCMARKAADILRDLAKARDAATPDEQSASLLDILSGQGASGLAYDKILKVLIQLCDARDIWAEFYLQIDKKKAEDTDARYVLNKDKPDGGLLNGASRAVSRFAEPSRLSD